jgi:hypothetical protein
VVPDTAGGDAPDGGADSGIEASDDAAVDAIDAGCSPTGAEECFNGVDDDCNGLVDCVRAAAVSRAQCAHDMYRLQLRHRRILLHEDQRDGHGLPEPSRRQPPRRLA